MSSKRTAVHLELSEGNPDRKITKIHPFFSKPTETPGSGPFVWLDPLGPKKTCLHGVNLHPLISNKVAAFDLDGTIIKSSIETKSSVGWEWWKPNVPVKLKELHDSGYAIVFLSNQALKPLALKNWKEKIVSIAGSASLSHIPFRLFAATAKDRFRKPMPGMWMELENIFLQADTKIGDAAGRNYASRKADFSSTDRKFALNMGISFYTPEEYFLQLSRHTSFILPGFHVSSLPNLPHIMPTSSPILPSSPQQELVMFVGYPCLGKTSLYHRYFSAANYVHINQDILKTREKCVKASQAALKGGKSCVIDNTNRNAATRRHYIDIAKGMNIAVRCFLFTGSIELAWHNNLYRAYIHPFLSDTQESTRELVPYGAFTGFRDDYEEPTLSEGMIEIKKVNWVFDGTEKEKRFWSMWLQIDGK